MSEKWPPLNVIKEIATKEGAELSDEMLDAVAGGAYSDEEWNNMTEKERKDALTISFRNKYIFKLPCALD